MWVLYGGIALEGGGRAGASTTGVASEVDSQHVFPVQWRVMNVKDAASHDVIPNQLAGACLGGVLQNPGR